MGVSVEAGTAPRVKRDHGFHALRVLRVVPESRDASSIVFEVPDDLKPTYEYRAGQFLTLRLAIDGGLVTRSYSMSSSPDADEHVQVTVKRIAGGLASNWINDNVRAGDVIEASAPAGRFTLTGGTDDVILFGAGSGITPVFSLLKTALVTTGRNVRLLYGNRDAESIIFGDRIAELVAAHRGRIDVEHFLEAERGFVDSATIDRYVMDGADADYYVCGPGPFMDVVETALLGAGVDGSRVHIERFLPAGEQELPPAEATAASSGTVEIDLFGKVTSGEHRAGTTILQTARSFGETPPYGCEAGNCGACMAMLDEGDVVMHLNDALTDEEVEEGWILTCQAVPSTPCVRVRYA